VRMCVCVFFFQAEDGIRDYKVTAVQTCALPIYATVAKGSVYMLNNALSLGLFLCLFRGRSRLFFLLLGLGLAHHYMSQLVLLPRSEEHTSELQSPCNLVCRLLLEKKKNIATTFLCHFIVILVHTDRLYLADLMENIFYSVILSHRTQY